VQWARKYRILYRSPDGSATYESKGPDHSELLIVRPDGTRFSEEIAACGFCLDGGGRCEFHPDGPQAGVFGPVYPSDLLADRQVSTPVAEPASAAVADPVAEPVAASAKPSKPAKRSREPVSEPAPVVDEQLEESARLLGLRVWDGGAKPHLRERIVRWVRALAGLVGDRVAYRVAASLLTC
jgi:hypothetical protein